MVGVGNGAEVKVRALIQSERWVDEAPKRLAPKLLVRTAVPLICRRSADRDLLVVGTGH
jgi:hypothetical protein